jgi:hypothetical protein
MLAGISLSFALCTAHYWTVFSNIYLGLVSKPASCGPLDLHLVTLLQMVQGFSIGNEDSTLVAADSIVLFADCVGQLILVNRHITSS